jgi:hypothetical protein
MAKFKIKESVEYVNENKGVGIVITYINSIFHDGTLYNVFWPQIKEYQEDINENNLKKIKHEKR